MTAPDTNPFPQSVASFDPTPDGVLLWTRTEVASRVSWVVAHDRDLTAVVREGAADVGPAGHIVVVDVDGLDPATTYFYAFTAAGHRSPVGRTRTLPATDAEVTAARIAVVSCANLARAPLTVTRAVAALDDVDLVLHAGDYIYEDDGAKGDIPVDPPHVLVTVDDYRRRYRQARSDTDLQALHEQHPMVAVWDDHDVADNTWDGGAKAHDPDEHGPFADRLEAATTARREWVPWRADAEENRRQWRSVAFGDLAELVVLDTRLSGRDRQPDDGEDLDDPDRSMLSEAQWRWASERITDRSRRWCLLSSQVPVSVMELPMPDLGSKRLDDALPDGYGVRDGVALCTDQWDGYRAERRRLVDLLDRRGGGAVIVSADIHSSWVIDGPFTDDLRPVAGEVVATSISSTTMGGNLGRLGSSLAERIADEMDHVRWCDLDELGFLVLDVTADHVTASAWAVDADDRSATATRMATWTIGGEAGARWAEVVDDPERPDTVEGLAPTGPPAGGLQPRRHRVARTALRTVAVGAAAVATWRAVRAWAGRSAPGAQRR